MHICIISASPRLNSQSLRVAKYLDKRLKNLNVSSSLIDLNHIKLPIYDESDEVKYHYQWLSIKEVITESDGYVIVAPEWNGMAPPAYKNLLMFVGHSMAHKPYMVCGVSAGRGGIHVIDELRATGQKNTHLVMSPENIVASQVESLELDESFNEDSEDHWFKTRAEYALNILIAYSKGLKSIRESSVIDFERFPSGI